MIIALLMVSMIAAAASAALVWPVAGFWWALAAYSGTGAVTLLATAALSTFLAARQVGSVSQFGKAEAAR